MTTGFIDWWNSEQHRRKYYHDSPAFLAALEAWDYRNAERDELVAALSTMLGAAEIDCMDDKSNVWRSAMIDARAALAKVK